MVLRWRAKCFRKESTSDSVRSQGCLINVEKKGAVNSVDDAFS